MIRALQAYVLFAVMLVMLRTCALTKIEPGQVGVRYNNMSGALEEDLEPGWHWELPGVQRVWALPAHYTFLNFAEDSALSIRTKDNNTVMVDVTVPYRIIPDHAYKVMLAGNHLVVGQDLHRFQRLANEVTISVLREKLAALQSQDFYDTDRRLKVADETLTALNQQLATLDLEAEAVLVRAAYFRDTYERQLAQIQLNEQQKLLDGAKRIVAGEKQKLDNFVQQTAALVAAKEQDWARRIAELDRAYQVGYVGTDDHTPGASRRALVALKKEERDELVARAAKVYNRPPEEISEMHLLGIKSIEAETTEYAQRVRAEADGISARLSAEGEQMMAEVKGDYESKLNVLLGTPGGRAYVAYQAAENVKFDDTLVFQSRDGIPAVLRLRDFARAFMGGP